MKHPGYVFGIVPVPLFILIAAAAAFVLVVFILVIAAILRNAAEHRRNMSLPPQNDHARVVAKRTAVSGEMTTTRYYVTFELDSRERVELRVAGSEYGMLAEGDEGTLTRQGTEYVSFVRM
jgi:hypothetical protein